ncbi:hypothetical protein V6N13_049086 [Hibiscus sabdariffa]|uniref:Piwi domain-containing protein n=1 Tax=Hibiscus sabdariffa TaxID=183260 RepID=A0ABR2QY96_9ROSI
MLPLPFLAPKQPLVSIPTRNIPYVGVRRCNSDNLNEACRVLFICPNVDRDQEMLSSIIANTIGGGYENICKAVKNALHVARKNQAPSALIIGRKFSLSETKNYKKELEDGEFIVDIVVGIDKTSHANVLICPNEYKDPTRVLLAVANIIGGDYNKTFKAVKKALYLARNKNDPYTLIINCNFT